MPVKVAQSCWTLCSSMGYTGQNTGVGSCSRPGIKPRSPTLQADSLPAESQRKPIDARSKGHSLEKRTFMYLHVCVWGGGYSEKGGVVTFSGAQSSQASHKLAVHFSFNAHFL